MSEALKVRVTPFEDWKSGAWTTSWNGAARSIDGTDTTLPTAADIERVLYQGETGDTWDGDVAAVIKLKDGRLLAYETFYGPTGDGFFEDAYGGDATVWFAREENLPRLVLEALTDEGRRLCGIPAEGLGV